MSEQTANSVTDSSSRNPDQILHLLREFSDTYTNPQSLFESVERSSVFVGIPAYNAENTIGAVVERVSGVADFVLVVDDGSKDETAMCAREAGATVVRHKRNRGYGGALQTIFSEANKRDIDHLITLDADEQHDPGSIPQLVGAQIDSGADIVIGSRYAAGSATDLPVVRSIGLSVVNLLTNWSMGRFSPRNWIRDTQSGFRVYSSEVVESLATADGIGDGMWASTDILYHTSREGFSFLEVGTTIRYDVEHGSTEGAVSHGLSLVSNIFRFAQRTHPIVLLGLPGTLSFIFGAVLAVWTLELVVLSQLVAPYSVLMVISSSVFILLGTSLVFLSWILHSFNIHPHFQR